MAEAAPWTRIPDWVSLVAGGYLAVSPLWVSDEVEASWSMLVIGVAIAVMAVIALMMPGAYIDEWMTAAGGVVAIVAPWVFDFHGAAAWTSHIVGLVVVGAALAALPASRAEYRRVHPV